MLIARGQRLSSFTEAENKEKSALMQQPKQGEEEVLEQGKCPDLCNSPVRAFLFKAGSHGVIR